MDSNQELDYKEIGKITSDFIKVSDQLKITCKKIIENKFSNHPIIILSNENINFGTLFLDKNEIMNNKWKYFASYLEILYEKKIISNIQAFKENYKNYEEFCCLLVAENNNSKIIFIHYPED